MEKRYSKVVELSQIPTDALTSLRQEGVIDADHPTRAYYRGIISNGNLDSHFSRMAESTLRNFAEGAANGVSVLDSHNHRTVGIGMSVTGEYEDGNVYSDFYLVREIPLGASQSFASTDGFIKMIEDGALRDISVGFTGGTEYCDICGGNIWSYAECRHWPGNSYIVGEGDEEVIVICTTHIEGAELSEFSLVFDGSTPSAEITDKANVMAENGLIDIKQKYQIEKRFNIRFKEDLKFPEPEELIVKPSSDKIIIPDNYKVSDKRQSDSKGENTMAKTIEELQQEVTDLTAQLDEVRANADTYKEQAENATALEAQNDTLKARNEKLEERDKDNRDTIERVLGEKRAAEQAVEEMKPMADEGKRARKEAEDKAIKEYTRLQGEDLDDEKLERQKRTLSNLGTLDDVRDMGETWAEAADDKYPKRRQTTDGDDDKEGDDDKNKSVITPDVPGPDAY